MSAIARLLVKAIALTLVAASLALASGTQATAAEPGTVGGNIMAPDGATAPLSGLVSLWQWDPEEGAFDQYRATSLTAATSPAPYTFAGVPAGDYYVRFGDAGETYHDAFSGGATTAPTTPESAGVIHLSDEDGATDDLTLVSRPAPQPVTGTVVSDAGAGLADVSIEAWVQRTGGLRLAEESSTNGSGGFSLQLRPGTYDLRFRSTDGLYEPLSLHVEVPKAPLALGDLQLELSGPAQVRGRILGSNGKALAGAVVRLYRLTGEPGSYEAEWTDAVTAGSNGTYTFDDVSTDNTYTVAASGWMHRFTALGGGHSLGQAEGFDVLGDVGVADLTLAAASGLRGTVTSASLGVPGVTADLYQWVEDEDGARFELVDEASTDSSGGYRFNALDAGRYTVFFDATDATQGASRWLVGSTVPLAATSSGVFEVGAQASQVVQNVSLTSRQRARGSVLTGSSRVSSADVVGYRYAGSGKWVEFGRARTSSSGSFSMPVPSNVYVTFRFSKSGYATTYLKSTRLPSSASSANAVHTRTTTEVSVGTGRMMKTSATTAKLAKAKIVKGKSTKVTVTVKVSGVSPTGKVAVYDGRKRIKTVTLTSGRRGVVVVKLTKPKKGKHKISARYLGSSTSVASVSRAVTLKVVKKKR